MSKRGEASERNAMDEEVPNINLTVKGQVSLCFWVFFFGNLCLLYLYIILLLKCLVGFVFLF
jgi:hypothetical protein